MRGSCVRELLFRACRSEPNVTTIEVRVRTEFPSSEDILDCVLSLFQPSLRDWRVLVNSTQD